MKVAGTVSLIVAALLALAVWYFQQSAADAQRERDELANAHEELLVRFSNLEQEKTAVANRLEGQIAGLSEEKRLELERLRSTYDTLVTDLKGEIEQGHVTITRLVDRLSVRMVDKILFSSGEAVITAQGMRILERVGNVLKNAGMKAVRVEGHTDNVAVSHRLAEKFSTNWELSTARATHVVRFLQGKVGIAPVRLEAVGMSEFHPVATNKTRVGRSQNRRIEIALLPEVGGTAGVAK